MGIDYRRDVDGLRAVAVLSVVLYHAFGAPFSGGFVGVDIFFVISGFIITSILMQQFADGRFSLLDFLERRVRRILPPLFLVIAVSMILGIWFYLPGDLTTLGVSAIWALLFLANFFFLIEIDYFAAPPDSYPLLHLWSLAVEEQFYVVLPMVFLLCFSMGIRRVLTVVATLSLLSFLSAVAIFEVFPKGAFYMLPARFWELGVGVMLALARLDQPKRVWAHVAGLLGIGLIAFALWGYSDQTPFPGIAALPPVLGSALVIWAGPQSVVGRILSVPPMVAIGLISYGFYLWHWPLLAFYRYVMMDDVRALGLVGVVILSLVLSAVSYRFVEQPIRRRRWVFRERGRIFALALSCTAMLSAVAILTSERNGLPNRWNTDALSRLTAGSQSDYGHRAKCQTVEYLKGQFVCGIGRTEGTIDFVVWGDSHTISMQAGFARFAEQAGQRGVLVGHSACLGLLGARNTRMPIWHDCVGNNDRVLSYIKRVRPETVVLVSRWTNFPHFEFLRDDRPRSWLANSLPPLRHRILKTAVDETLQALHGVGISRIVWMRTVPEQKHDIPRLMARSVQWQHPLPKASPLADHINRHLIVDRAFAPRDGLVLIAPEIGMCVEGVCGFQVDGIPLYDDVHHISPAGSEVLWPLISNALDPTDGH
ncbi:MAG: acyltransferase family protein [Roseobacter sp.]